MEKIIDIISNKLNVSAKSVANTIRLLDEGATIPFIARYRKEVTLGLDEVKIEEIATEKERMEELSKRKETVLSQIENQGALTDELRTRIKESWNLTEIEDIYLPYKPKRRTKAQVAREAGLEPLATTIMLGRTTQPLHEAKKFLGESIDSEDKAISGASDIIAEMISEHETARNIVRQTFERTAMLHSSVVKGKEEEGANYTDYFDKKIRLDKCPSHTLLAIRRGEKEKILKVKIVVDDDRAIEHLHRRFVRCNGACSGIVENAITDSYKRLLFPSIETEFASSSKHRADEEAVRIFASNLRQLLLASPLGQRRTMGIDPGFRTGCKIVCLDSEGNLLHHDVIYPHPPANKTEEAKTRLISLTKRYGIEAIAVGNGTAGRETEQMLRETNWSHPMSIYMVSENGASIYSASEVARKEFPNEDVTVRGAVSIARRLMDPLSELVKIDAKSIGVGQYQHDVDQALLRHALDQTVESCVNSVGVELNNASEQLLMYIAGIGPQIAKNIVAYRTENGAFSSRRDLLKVPKLGKKAYEQCAGFIRVKGSSNPLDHTAVHPECYHVVEAMAHDLGCKVDELINNQQLRKKIDIKQYITTDIGLPTLSDIMSELEKPGRDPRGEMEQWAFDANVQTMNDLQIGMELNGIVTNITNFGAFVNIGIKENGLLHVSQISNRRISSPAEVLSIGEHIKVKVLSIDEARKRIQLTMK